MRNGEIVRAPALAVGRVGSDELKRGASNTVQVLMRWCTFGWSICACTAMSALLGMAIHRPIASCLWLQGGPALSGKGLVISYACNLFNVYELLICASATYPCNSQSDSVESTASTYAPGLCMHPAADQEFPRSR
jgi:hypothetical protein